MEKKLSNFCKALSKKAVEKDWILKNIKKTLFIEYFLKVNLSELEKLYSYCSQNKDKRKMNIKTKIQSFTDEFSKNYFFINSEYTNLIDCFKIGNEIVFVSEIKNRSWTLMKKKENKK